MTDTPNSRRTFLTHLARIVAAGALALGGGWLMTKKTGETCVSNGICRDCGTLSACKLPQALSTRQARGGR
jgi:hypothetical protein